MELDELKSAWAQYDKKLAENLKLNERLLRKMNLDKIRQELQKPFLYEMVSIIITFLAIAFVTRFSIRLITEIQFSLTGLIAILVCIVYLIFAIMKANRFIKIDYYNSTVIKLQKDLSLLKTFILRLRKVELILIPLLVLTFLPIVSKAIHNINIIESSQLFVIAVALILGIGYPISFWINKNLYDKRIKDAELFLKEIENFEKEE